MPFGDFSKAMFADSNQTYAEYEAGSYDEPEPMKPEHQVKVLRFMRPDHKAVLHIMVDCVSVHHLIVPDDRSNLPLCQFNAIATIIACAINTIGESCELITLD